MRADHAPRDELLLEEHRDDGELVRVVDSPVDRLVAIEDIAWPDTYRWVIPPVLQDELDGDLPGHAVQVCSKNRGHKVPTRGVDSGHRVPGVQHAGDPHLGHDLLASW